MSENGGFGRGTGDRLGDMLTRRLDVTFAAVALIAGGSTVAPWARGLAAEASETQASTAPAAPCGDPEYRRFDFWVGDWGVYEVGDETKAVARARIDVILGGCALREVYEQAGGLVGQSFTAFDAGRKVWHQTWVTNRGQLLMIEGRFQGSAVTLQGPQVSADGQESIVRGVWVPDAHGVRETAHTSKDSGATWQPWFDIVFRHHGGGAAAVDDEKAVAALDTQYQAAVKANDVETMDRILADNFVLVNGRGIVSTKADLLAEARSRRVQYERQEDTSQKVRVFGDTAVVTALLWAKGTDGGKPFDYTLWFSDTYVRTPKGWRYAFAQASTRLPPTP